MTLTPASLRLDLKCGRGAISEGEKCHVGQATRVKDKPTGPSTARRALKVARQVGEFVGPDLAAEVVMAGATFALGRLASRRRGMRGKTKSQRMAERALAVKRNAYGRPQGSYTARRRRRPRRDTEIQFIPTQYIQPTARRDGDPCLGKPRACTA